MGCLVQHSPVLGRRWTAQRLVARLSKQKQVVPVGGRTPRRLQLRPERHARRQVRPPRLRHRRLLRPRVLLRQVHRLPVGCRTSRRRRGSHVMQAPLRMGRVPRVSTSLKIPQARSPRTRKGGRSGWTRRLVQLGMDADLPSREEIRRVLLLHLLRAHLLRQGAGEMMMTRTTTVGTTTLPRRVDLRVPVLRVSNRQRRSGNKMN